MASYRIAGFDKESGEREEEHPVTDREAIAPIVGTRDPAPDDFVVLTADQAREVAKRTGLPLLPDDLEYFFEVE